MLKAPIESSSLSFELLLINTLFKFRSNMSDLNPWLLYEARFVKIPYAFSMELLKSGSLDA